MSRMLGRPSSFSTISAPNQENIRSTSSYRMNSYAAQGDAGGEEYMDVLGIGTGFGG
jgi:hypothetical protein